jgi:hypothetical protein
MTAWRRRERRAQSGAAIVLAVLLMIGVVAYYYAGPKLGGAVSSPLPGAPAANESGSSTLTNLLKMFESFTSHLSLELPGLHVGEDNVTSNWAGYIAMAQGKSSASYVNGTWTTPSLTCTSTSRTGVLFWIGLGGVSPAPLEQIGTTAFCLNGQPTYDAWYEAVPTENHIVVLNETPSPGERVHAALTYSNSTDEFTYEITIGSQAPETFTQSYANVTAPMSAEWVVEAPFTPFGAITMANFGSVSFHASATVGGQTGGPAVFTKSLDAYLLRSTYLCNDHSGKAAPGRLLTSDSFTVTWESGNC